MPRRKLDEESGHYANLFGNGQSRQRRRSPSPPGLTREKALRISQQLGFLERQQTPPPDSYDNDDVDNWENIDNYGPDVGINSIEIEVDSSGDNYARHQRSLRRAEARARNQSKWKALEAQLTATYLHLRHHTHNWTNQPTFHSYLSNGLKCRCPPDKLRRRRVDFIDLLISLIGLTSKHSVTFCGCVPDVIRLLYVGYIGGSPQFPRTAFSIRLVQLHHHFWNHTSISTSGFIDALMAFLDILCPVRLTPQQYKAKPAYKKNLNRSLRHPFTQTIDIYCRILLGQQALYEEGLGLTPIDLSAAQCSRCFGPAEGEIKSSPNEPDFIIAMDGNFQHRHQSHASKDSPQEDQYPSSFIKPSKLEKEVVACNKTNAQANHIKTSCSDSHTAANDVRNSTSWDRCDYTGLFAGACRHDVPLYFANIYQSGEKLYYPVAILKQLQELHPDKFIAVLYDIGCHLDVHIEKMMFGTSVFHAYVHQWACQLKYHPRFNEYWGLSDGEGLERLWSFLSALVAPLRISTRLHRLLAIHWRLWLRRRFLNAVKVLEEAQDAVTSLCAMPNPYLPGEKYSHEFFRGQWAAEREAYASKEAVLLKQKLELGRLLSLQDELNTNWSRPNLTPEQAIVRLRTTSELQEKIAKQAAKVGTTDVLALDDEQEAFLMLWYSKNEVGLKYIAICEEKRPLQQSRSDGHESNLGQDKSSHCASKACNPA
ncbi:uncharacterized protein MELLADRAFT_96026 [Melampsora larici-populina 98AG31]|uniref:CxC1-like cysteine cluster associated with KDZ transposases domain-containing protein n=1 Tax=Melampsora larici-populina (strain 98AG31 / pathotype 3-4-7) TaxID=747676 RepID=F4SAM5_MELLP|nr:uncharacterized protein MELLADRAFT_96026 [Melampsora larici-populina 98AG31]EGF98310.1 hypothetical protein MELLADRAFT_96026 [Melampsora larici-populina 98AG31]